MKLSSKNPSRLYGGLIFLFSVVFYAFVMYCSPFSSDDIEHIIYDRTEIRTAIKYVLYYGNGRFLGNLTTIYLCNNTVLRILCKAFSSALLIALLPMILKVYTPRTHLLSFLLITCMSGSLFGQVFTWTSGFANYIPPIFLCSVVVYLLNTYADHGSKYSGLLFLPLIFVLSVACQLYNEIASIFNCLLSSVFLFSAIRKKKNIGGSLTFAAASFCGAVIMYLIPILFYVENNRSTGYRSFAGNNIKALLVSIVTHSASVAAYIAENVLLCLVVCFCAYHVLTRNRLPRRFTAIAKQLIIASAIYFLCNYFVNNGMWYGRLATARNFLSVIFVLIPFTSLLIGIMFSKAVTHKMHFIVLSVLSMLVILPLLVVNPISSRCLVQFYIVQTAIILLYFSHCVRLPESNIRVANRFLCMTAAAVSIVLSLAFSNIHWLSTTLDQYINLKMEQGASEIAIYPIPYDYVFWDGTAAYPYWHYYSEPGDITFTAIPYSDWSYLYGTELLG